MLGICCPQRLLGPVIFQLWLLEASYSMVATSGYHLLTVVVLECQPIMHARFSAKVFSGGKVISVESSGSKVLYSRLSKCRYSTVVAS